MRAQYIHQVEHLPQKIDQLLQVLNQVSLTHPHPQDILEQGLTLV